MNKKEKLARLDYEDSKSRILFGVAILITLFLGLCAIVIANPYLNKHYIYVIGGFAVFVIWVMIRVFGKYEKKYKKLEDIIKKQNSKL